MSGLCLQCRVMAEQLPLLIFQTIVGCLGICGNCLVCVVIIKVHFMHTITNAFIFNQALIDFLGSLVLLLSSVVPIPDQLPPGAGGFFICYFWISQYFIWAFFITSTFNLVSMTCEKYLAIVYPFRYQRLATPRNVIITIVTIWLVGFTFVIYNIFMNSFENGECPEVDLPFASIIFGSCFILTYLIPVLSMLFIYIHITIILKKGAGGRVAPAAVPSTSGSKAVESQGESLMRARRNTFKTLLIVFITYAVCWFPNEIVIVSIALGLYVDYTSVWFLSTVALVAANSCLNPFIYAIKYKQFRKALKVLCGKGFPIGNESYLSTISTGTPVGKLHNTNNNNSNNKLDIRCL